MVKANFARAKELYPGGPDWVTFFETADGFKSFGRLIGDIYQKAKIEEDRENGIRRLGRKPRVATSLDEVMATVFPEQFSNDPFPVAFEHLLNGRSQRQFAMRCGVNQSTLSRFLAGVSKPDLYTMARVAEAAKVPPSYFVEWRALYVGTLFTKILIEYPHLGIAAIKKLRSF